MSTWPFWTNHKVDEVLFYKCTDGISSSEGNWSAVQKGDPRHFLVKPNSPFTFIEPPNYSSRGPISFMWLNMKQITVRARSLGLDVYTKYSASDSCKFKVKVCTFSQQTFNCSESGTQLQWLFWRTQNWTNMQMTANDWVQFYCFSITAKPQTGADSTPFLYRSTWLYYAIVKPNIFSNEKDFSQT